MSPMIAKSSLEQQKVGFRPLISSAISRVPAQLAGWGRFAGAHTATYRTAEQTCSLFQHTPIAGIIQSRCPNRTSKPHPRRSGHSSNRGRIWLQSCKPNRIKTGSFVVVPLPPSSFWQLSGRSSCAFATSRIGSGCRTISSLRRYGTGQWAV